MSTLNTLAFAVGTLLVVAGLSFAASASGWAGLAALATGAGAALLTASCEDP